VLRGQVNDVESGAGLRRLARVGLLSAATVALGVLAHRAGGGSVPSQGVIALVAAPVILTWLALTARVLRGGTIVVSLAALQALIHAAFSWLEPMHATTVVIAGHPGEVSLAHAPATGSAPLLTGLAMLSAHTGATLAVAVLLRHGEELLCRAWDVLRPGAFPTLPVVVALPAITGWDTPRTGVCRRPRSATAPRAPPRRDGRDDR